MAPSQFRRSVLPFLLLAYPVTFLLFQGGSYCEPVCFVPTPLGVGTVVATLFVCILVAIGVGTVYTVDDRKSTYVKSLVPSHRVSLLLLALFGSFVAFRALDAIDMYEGIWKPVVLPTSVLLFLPVWVLYMVSFPLAILFSVAGIESPPVVTLIFRGVVVFIGFPLSAVFQTGIASAIVDAIQSQE